MGDLFDLRLGGPTILAVLAAAGLPAVAWVFTLLERAGRLRAATNASHRSLRTDLWYFFLSPLTELLSKILTTLAIVASAFAVGRHVGPELLGGFGPVAQQPRWLVVAEMLVLGDFIYYWTHRLAHTAPALWRLHAVHHSTRHLRWTSALRAHPAEAYTHLLSVVPLFLLGFPVDALAPLTPIVTLYAFFIHTGVNVPLRSLSYVLNSPTFHGWHHAKDVEGAGMNFAGLFPVFDALFGTYTLPDHLPSALGIDDSAMPETCLAQLEYPFRSGSAESPATSVEEHGDDRETPSMPVFAQPAPSSGFHARV